MSTKSRVPAIDGWFTLGDEPALLGTRCTSCGSVFFPRETYFCKNPDCLGREFTDVELSRTGTVWSFTNNCFEPPAPYMSPSPFVPYTIAAVELEAEKMVVLGQVVPEFDVTTLHAGMKVELVLGTLYEDDDNEYLVWKWRPMDAAGETTTGAPEGADR